MKDLMILVERLKEVNLSTKRFLKVDIEKRAFEKEWQNKLYGPEDLDKYPRWGIAGKEGLVLIDVDNKQMENIMRSHLPHTFETISPRRKLPHFYLKVINGDVENKILYVPKEKEGAGEIRAQNHYLVAPSAVITYNDLETGIETTGEYRILNDQPIAVMDYKIFMEVITPFLGHDVSQPITHEQIRDGVPRGTRHAQGMKYATLLIKAKKMDYPTALHAMKEWNKLCDPPMNEKDLERMVKNAIRYPDRKKKETDDWSSIDANGKITFNPVKFAKYLMENHQFKTTRDNETIFVFNWDQGVYEDWGKIFVREQMVKELDEATREYYQKDILFFIKGSTYMDREHNPLGIVAVDNGYLNVVTKELQPYTPELFITSRLHVKYDPEATCPKIVKFLTEVVSEDQLDVIQEVFGYCLYKDTPFHKSLMLVGEGSNGKSTMSDLLKILLGSDNVNNATLQALCSSRFAVADLYGKLANICSDIPSDALRRTGMFKMLVGGDTVNAQKKFQHPFNFKNHAKLIFSANQIPETQDDTLAFFRRWLIIECNNIFIGENCNPNILREIATPEGLSGLLNFALEGLARLLKNGGFSTTETMAELRNQYIRRSNSAKAFVEECLEFSSDANKYVTTDKMYANYIEFCQNNKLRSMTKRILTLNMQQYQPHITKTQRRIRKKRVWVWQNVTTVTSSPFKSKRMENNGKTSLELNKQDVTPVTPTTCPLCHFALPKQRHLLARWEGTIAHKHCVEDVEKGRKEAS